MEQILILGGSGGLGQSVIDNFVNKGWGVVFTSTTQDGIAKVINKYPNADIQGFLLKNDDTFFENLSFFLGGKGITLDALINCIGGAEGKLMRVKELKTTDWIRSFDLNFMSYIRAIHYLSKTLKKNSVIISVSSMAGIRPSNFNPQYGASKAALNYVQKYLIREYSDQGFIFHTVSPGSIDNETLVKDTLDFSNKNSTNYEDSRGVIISSILNKQAIKKLISNQDVVDVIDFLICKKIPTLTGLNINIDAGLL